jgi:hypothetical protein
MKRKRKVSGHVDAAGLAWNDPNAVRAWLGDLDPHLKDLVEVAQDQVDAPGRRIHGRRGARRIIDAAARALRQRLDYAARGLAAQDEPAAADPRAGGPR